MIKDVLAGQEEWRTFKELQDRASRLNAHLQARKMEKEQETRSRTTPPPGKTETKPTFDPKPAFNPRSAFIPATRGTPPTALRPSPAHTGPMPMELDSLHRRMSQEEHDRCIRGALCFTCKEYRHVSREYPKKRTRIIGAEVALGQELPSGNDDTQE